MLLVTLISMLSNPIVICAIIFAAFGLAVSLLSNKITKTVRKSDSINPDDKILLSCKIIGLGLILLGFVLLFIASIQ